MSDVPTENANQSDDAFFDSVIADIDNSAIPEIISGDEDESEDDEVNPSSSGSTPSNVPSQEKRKNQNRAQERIQQLVLQKNTAETRLEAANERTKLAHDKIALLQSQLDAYEPVIREFNEFKAMYESGNSESAPAANAAKSDKPLTAAELDRLLEERENKRRQTEQSKRDADILAGENEKIIKDWTPHVKRVKAEGYPMDKQMVFNQFISKVETDRQRRDLIKVLGKYDNAVEIVQGLSKKPGFDSLSLAEQVEIAVKLNDKIIQHKQKTTESVSTTVESKMKKDTTRPTSYEEFLKSKRR